MPAALFGSWSDLNGYGVRDPGAAPSITFALFWLLGPLLYAKFYAVITLLFVGVCAWSCLRQWGLGRLAAAFGGLVAALSPDFFAVSCWGVGSQALCFGLNYLALGLVVSIRPMPPWVRYPLAGFLVGMGVLEAADIGAIFSVVTAVLVVAHCIITHEHRVKGAALGCVRVGVIAAFAAVIAASALSSLVGTQIKGVVGTDPDQRTKLERWNWATQWSLPKRESLGMLVPGLFGHRMDSPDGGAYWGFEGRDPAWDQYFASGKQGPPPRGFIRYGGGATYLGVFVLMVALWAATQSTRGQASVFSLPRRKWVWFLMGVMFVSLLLGFGRFAPFYQFFYELPYASTIRNPAKFLHVFQWALVLLFGIGMDGLARRMDTSGQNPRGMIEQLETWWKRQASAFDRNWVRGLVFAMGAGLAAWGIFASSRESLINYLQEGLFAPETANAIAGFSISQVGWFLVLLAVASTLFTLVLSGYFCGRRVGTGVVLIGLFLVIDLARVGANWVITYDWKERYVEPATNPLFDLLRQHPNQQRVTIVPEWLPRGVRAPQNVAGAQDLLGQVYGSEWLQHLFQFYDIQSLDIIQMPRVPQDIAAFEMAMQFDGKPEHLYRIARKWQLTNTRYILCATGLGDAVKLLDPESRRFKPVMMFEFFQDRMSGPILLRTNTAGPFELLEFTGALPRARLYSQWQVLTNDTAVLQRLDEKDFDPEKTVLVSNTPGMATSVTTNVSEGVVEILDYAPKKLVMRAKSEFPAVLLVNDKFDSDWLVKVDGQAANLLRLNFIMRGVFLDKPGIHRVEFEFRPPRTGLYISLAAIAVALGLITYLGIVKSAPKPV